MKKRLLIGTNNPSKLRLFQTFFDADEVECVSPTELGLSVAPPENERTAEGNALQKAIAYHQASGLPVFTEDSGLVFLDLPKAHPGQPGVYVRRPANHPPLTDDEDMLEYYANIVRKHGGQMRAAWCILGTEHNYATYADDDESLYRHAMIMVDVPCAERHPGWPLDSLTVSSVTGKHWATMTLEEKEQARRREYIGIEEDRKRMLAWLNDAMRRIL